MTDFNTAKSDFISSLDQPDFMFETTLGFIEKWFDFTPSAFNNGGVANEANENQGSCKVFALQQLLDLSKDQTLKAFGQHYRDVVATPDVSNHHNLRRVLKDEIGDITFDSFPLKQK